MPFGFLFRGYLSLRGGGFYKQKMIQEEKLISDLEKLNTATITLITRISKQQEEYAVDRLIESLNAFQLTPSGTIDNTANNINRISGLIENYRAVIFTPEFTSNISALLFKHYQQIAKLQQEYFLKAEQVSGNIKLLNALQSNALTTTITDLQYAGVNTTGLNRVLSASVSDNLTLSQAGRLIKQNVPGELTRYANEIVTDSLYQYERNVTKVVTNDLGLQHYYYSGTVRETTRPFCKTRSGNAYTETEVRSWGKLGDWAGKIEGTNEKTIFTYLGGYNCRHRLLPITERRYSQIKNGG